MKTPDYRGDWFAVLDAARNLPLVQGSLRTATSHESLYAGQQGKRLDAAAPHLVDLRGAVQLVALTLGSHVTGELGFVMETRASFQELRKHLRRFLLVRRERDGRVVYFRYYDPRILRSFLPACTEAELRDFFGPIERLHCQAERKGEVYAYELAHGRLVQTTNPLANFCAKQLSGDPCFRRVPVRVFEPGVESSSPQP